MDEESGGGEVEPPLYGDAFKLGAIAAPVLAIQGRLDPYGTMAQLDRIEAAVKGPFTRVELDDCGHSPQRDKPAQTLAALVKFYDDIATGAPLP